MSSSPAVREITHLHPPGKAVLACEMHDLRARILGYRLAANELLDRAEDLERELGEKEELLDIQREADRELERPMRVRKARVM